MDVDEVSKTLNEMSKNAGTITFPVKYTATDGNRNIHKEFVRFAFDTSNNEYLMAIGKLLEYKKIFDKLFEMESRVLALESKLYSVPEKKEEEDELPKTF